MLILLEDKAQKTDKHNAKHDYWEQSGIKVIRVPLPVGDYVLLNKSIYEMLKSKKKVEKKDFLGLHARSVDTKFSLGEVYSCMIQGHERFAKEADKAAEYGVDLIFLVEEPNIKTIDDVQYWKNPHYEHSMRRYTHALWLKKNNKWNHKKRIMPPVTSKGLMERMIKFSTDHHCRWEFCSPAEAGKRVIELLTEGKNIGKT